MSHVKKEFCNADLQEANVVKWCLVYNGRFGRNYSGSEVRYHNLAEALVASDDVVIVSSGFSRSINGVNFVRQWNLLRVFIAFIRSDALLLHGGNPIILALATVASWFGVRVILDAYAPLWIELTSAEIETRERIPTGRLFRAYFSFYRMKYAACQFDGIIAGNLKQAELYKAIVRQSAGADRESMVKIIPYGVEQKDIKPNRNALIEHSKSRVCGKDIIFAWIGGVWPWFQIDELINAFAFASSRNDTIRLVFFGVNRGRFGKMLQLFQASNGREGALINLDYVEFNSRLEIWSSINWTVVWSSGGLENDYASRTRNFDSLGLRIPILQNEDNDWSPLIIERKIGVVSTRNQLAQDILAIASDPELHSRCRENMIDVKVEYSWSNFARKLNKLAQMKTRKAIWRIGSWLYLILLGIWFVVNACLHALFGVTFVIETDQ